MSSASTGGPSTYGPPRKPHPSAVWNVKHTLGAQGLAQHPARVGSAMSRLLKTGKLPEELSETELKAITRFACCAASLSTQKHGGITSVPDMDEVERKMRE